MQHLLLIMLILCVMLTSIVYAENCYNLNCGVNCFRGGGYLGACVAAACCNSGWFVSKN